MTTLVPHHVLASTSPVAVVGAAHPREGRAGDLERTLRSFLAPTRAEEGCRAYEIHRRDDAAIVFYEQWASGEALGRHLDLPMMQAFLERRHELLSRDLEVSFWTPIEPAVRPGAG